MSCNFRPHVLRRRVSRYAHVHNLRFYASNQATKGAINVANLASKLERDADREIIAQESQTVSETILDQVQKSLSKLASRGYAQNFLQKNYFDRVSKSNQKKSYMLFRDELSAIMNAIKYGEIKPVLTSPSLDVIMRPKFEDLPRLLHHLPKPSPLMIAFFKKKKLESTQDIVYYYLEQLFHEFHSKVILMKEVKLKTRMDISNPAEWYPQARKLRRKIILHLGPTNSGKTYNALKRLKESGNGYYAGPLRLLGREVYDRFKSEGFRVNLITGEEILRDYDEFGNEAALSSGTIEMISTTKKFDVVVLDEIQMIGDTFRGQAWTNALLGVQAKEIHLCGEESALPVIRNIASICGDEVIVNHYERLGKLKVAESPLEGGLDDLKKGDCIVIFSKKRILAYKDKLQQSTKLKCGVIYGALPAETRSSEAEKFNSGQYDVLLASDAIGMGLNLNIKRVIFDSSQKFNGSRMEPLTSSHIKQIGGRAGRFKVAPTRSTRSLSFDSNDNLKNPDAKSVGIVTAFDENVLDDVRNGMSKNIEYLKKAILWPSDEVFSIFMSDLSSRTTLKDALSILKNRVHDNEMFAISDIKSQHSIADIFAYTRMNLMLKDQLTISTAPLSDYLPLFNKVLTTYSNAVAKGFTRSVLDLKKQLPIDVIKMPIDTEVLQDHEALHKYLLLFMWMSNRYPTYFVDEEAVHEMKELLEGKIERILRFVKQKRIGGSSKKKGHKRMSSRPYEEFSLSQPTKIQHRTY